MSEHGAELTMGDLAARVPGSEVVGDGAHRVQRFVHPAEVSGARDLCVLMARPALRFLLADDAPHRCAIVDRKVAGSEGAGEVLAKLAAYLVVDRPRYALARIGALFSRRAVPAPGVHPTAVVGEGVELGEGVSIGPWVSVGAGARIGARTVLMANVFVDHSARLGEDCLVYPGVFVGHFVEIGDRVIIHPNAVVGGDGFAFESPSPNAVEQARRMDGEAPGVAEPLERIESLGGVRIGDDVEIGAGTTIDRATLGDTVVERGVKIDNLVQIGHGNQIGEHAILCAQVGLAGSSKIGSGAVLAGKVGVGDHLEIGANAVLMAKSGVTKNVPAGEVYLGMPARPVRETLRSFSLVAQLDDMRKRIRQLEERLEEQG